MNRGFYALKTSVVFVLALIVVLPLLMTLGGSLMSKGELSAHIYPVMYGTGGMARAPLLPAIPTLRQYVSLLFDTPTFLSMFWNSVRLALPTVCLQVLLGTLAAWGFAHYKFPFQNALFMVYVVLMVMPFQVTLVPTYLALDRARLLDTPFAVILPGAFNTFAVFLLRQFFLSTPASLLESARIDGASEPAIFALIGLPLSGAGIASLFILSFLDNWNLIEQPMTFIKSQNKWPLSLFLTKIGESNLDVAFAASVITLFPALLLFVYLEKYLVRGIQMSGIKE